MAQSSNHPPTPSIRNSSSAAAGSAPNEAPSARAFIASATFNIREIGIVLGVGRPLVKRLLESGQIPVHTIGGRKLVLRDDLLAWFGDTPASSGKRAQ